LLFWLSSERNDFVLIIFEAQMSLRKDSDIVNLRELAEIMGVSDNTLRELIRADGNFPVLGRGSHGVPYEFSVSAVST